MDDLISRQTALTALAEAMPSLTTPDGCGQFDHDIQVTDEAYVDCMRIIHDLPPAQPTGTNFVPVADCISRQAALDIYDDYNVGVENGELEAYGRYRKQMLELPSVQPGEDIRAMCGECDAWNQYKNYLQPGWIPWDSGKFPKESGTYTVTAYDGAKRRVTYAKYQKRLKRWELTGARAYWRVLAWMEKPIPWEGENP